MTSGFRFFEDILIAEGILHPRLPSIRIANFSSAISH